FFYAQCHQIAGNLARADTLYEQALHRWKEDNRVARAVAEFCELTGRPERALQILYEVYRRDPSQRWAARGVALLYTSRYRNTAAWDEAYKLAAPELGNTPEDRLARAILFTRSPQQPADGQKARDLLQGLVDELPADLATAATARNLLAQLELAQGRPEKAAQLVAAEAN